MKLLHNLIGILCGFAIIVVLLFTSIQAIAYWFPDYYRHEYTKYDVAHNVKVDLDDLLKVTDEMMDYLDGSREHLHDIVTTIDGVENTPFFNEREVAHMEDVRTLFLHAIWIRRILLGFLLLSILLIAMTGGNVFYQLSGGYIKTVLLFLSAFLVLIYYIFQDFSSAFVTFHHMFFRNDLWILDPATDNLIVIVPEGFFFDTAAYIGFLFVAGLFILLTISIAIQIHKKAAAKAAA